MHEMMQVQIFQSLGKKNYKLYYLSNRPFEETDYM